VSSRILVVDDSPTIRKVVFSILAAQSFEPVLASDGIEALSVLEKEKVDLVLLDFVMPRMNGYQFCRELRAHPAHKSLPVVLMSAKGDKIRGQFVQQTGAIDAITKPFDARGLIAVVEGALKKHEEGRARPIPDADAMPAEDPRGESLRPSRTFSDDTGLRRFQVAQEVATALEDLLLPELDRGKGGVALAVEDVRLALRRAVTPDAIAGLSTLIRALSGGENTREVLSGDISVISIAEVLQMLDLQRQSGALSLFTRKEEITLFIRDGDLDYATGRGLRDEFLIGRYLVENGALLRDDLANVLDHRAGSKRLLGEKLVQLGLVNEEQVRRALVRQTSELIYEVVRWKTGRFAFSVGIESPIAQKSRLGLETGMLVMEGFRRVDEWRLIEGSFDFDEVLYPDPVSIERLGSEANLTNKERAVLDAIDGERSIRDILGGMEGSSFELCKIVYQFLNSRLVRRKAAA
jgi:DNA-binding response OmpR family regulator